MLYPIIMSLKLRTEQKDKLKRLGESKGHNAQEVIRHLIDRARV